MYPHREGSPSSLSATASIIPAWSQPVFTQYNPAGTPGTSMCPRGHEMQESEVPSGYSTTTVDGLFPTSDRWIHAYDRRLDLDIFAFLLLNGFGDDPAITNYVGKNLIARVMNSEDLTKIVELSKRAKAMEGVAATTALASRIDEKIRRLVNRCFLAIDSECYETALEPFLGKRQGKEECDETGEANGANPLLLQSSGCSAILALIIDHYLYVANCGSSVAILGKEVGGELTIFQVSRTHEDTETPAPNPQKNAVVELMDELRHSIPNRCFGDFGRKTERRMAEASQATPTAETSSEPYFVGRIELNTTVRFLLMVPPVLSKAMQRLSTSSCGQIVGEMVPTTASCREDTANSALVALVTEALRQLNHSEYGRGLATSEALQKELAHVWERLSNGRVSNNAPEASLLPLSLAYINLENNFHPLEVVPASGTISAKESRSSFYNCSDVESPTATGGRSRASCDDSSSYCNDGSDATTSESAAAVTSEVDWSDFYTHELRETVLAKIESLKQHYCDNRKRGEEDACGVGAED